MSIWTLDTPPTFKTPNGKDYVATDRGWTDPDTGEVAVAISDLTTKAGPADVLSVAFDEASYSPSDSVTIIVHFNEKVDVVSGATVEAAWSGSAGNFVCTAVAQSGVYDVEFTGTVPAEAGTLSVAAQTILGTITDSEGAAAANLLVSVAAAETAGTRDVITYEIEPVSIDSDEEFGDPIL